ncbi:MAG: fibro-slime domain-containing protein [Fibromonadaceae bacterium]|jgi:fibro-slime domain-containing protein|nr:fibro-slime domain-containing protein [Fibromonadaceae bacterium]
MKTLRRFLLTAGISLALTFTFSCSSDDEIIGEQSSSSGDSSSKNDVSIPLDFSAYRLNAFIYDTDPGIHPDVYFDTYYYKFKFSSGVNAQYCSYVSFMPMPEGRFEFNNSNFLPEHFCFESHAQFIYQKGQVFDFRGNDDIWVYINSQLVIGSGSTYLAAPGHIKLDDMGLTEGMYYTIDIFFCDMRTTQSNVRISTNMYITQKSNFYQNPEDKKNTMCVETSGNNFFCANTYSGSGTSCGYMLLKDYDLDFYMIRDNDISWHCADYYNYIYDDDHCSHEFPLINNTSDVIWLSPSKNPENCVGTANTFTCYGGIVIDNGTYSCGGSSQCKGNPTATSKVNFSGDANVFVRLIENDTQAAKPLKIDEFKKE